MTRGAPPVRATTPRTEAAGGPTPDATEPGRPADPGWSAEGPPAAPPIVLVHGSRVSRAVWRQVTPFLAGEFRVIAVDLPGHGTRWAQPFTLAGAAAALGEVIDAAAGGRAVIVGHSLGGYVAMQLASSSPQRARGLVIAGASQEPSGPWRPAFRALVWLLESPLAAGLERLSDSYFRLRFGPAVADSILAGGYWARGGAAGIRQLDRRRFCALLGAYTGRTLILNGQLDPILRLGARRFRQAARLGSARVIPGATHLMQLDQPARFAACVGSFARSLPD